jgi:hypothetical protein
MSRTALALSFAFFACASAQKPAPSGPETFQAKLDVASEVPPPNVGAATPSGTATFVNDGGKVSYRVAVTGLSSAFAAAHVHGGAEGALGLVVVPLSLTGAGNGAAGEGVIDASMIKGTNEDASPMTMNDFLKALRSGGCYVNIHTAQNPKGEIRGQIRP